MEKPRGWVYFLQSGMPGPIKIGYTSRNVVARLDVLQVGNPEPLRLLGSVPGTRDDEKRLHKRFAALLIQGEWFRPEADLLAFIEGVALGYRDVASHDAHADEWLESVAEYCYLWALVRRGEDMLQAQGEAVSSRQIGALYDELSTVLPETQPSRGGGFYQFGSGRVAKLLAKLDAKRMASAKPSEDPNA